MSANNFLYYHMLADTYIVLLLLVLNNNTSEIFTGLYSLATILVKRVPFLIRSQKHPRKGHDRSKLCLAMIKKNYQAHLRCNSDVQYGYLKNGALYRQWTAVIKVNSKSLLNYAN